MCKNPLSSNRIALYVRYSSVVAGNIKICLLASLEKTLILFNALFKSTS
ncbi:hypothetical protein EI161_03785 [Psychrobacter sp. FME5]|nr:hypothetical protein [Psychrobacter sp. FME6]MBE0444403.1 hypothetical protein [Psychrobacter sp. FME5]